MEIRIIEESDAQLYQQLRLLAMKVNPEAFGSTYEREVAFSLETVKERLKPTATKFTLGAFVEEKLVGIVTFIRETSMKMAHKGYIFGMFVLPEMRGKKVGQSLLLALIQKAKATDGLEQIHLTVVSDNEPAKNLYKSLGFEVYGNEKNALKFNGTYYDEDLMALKL